MKWMRIFLWLLSWRWHWHWLCVCLDHWKLFMDWFIVIMIIMTLYSLSLALQYAVVMKLNGMKMRCKDKESKMKDERKLLSYVVFWISLSGINANTYTKTILPYHIKFIDDIPPPPTRPSQTTAFIWLGNLEKRSFSWWTRKNITFTFWLEWFSACWLWLQTWLDWPWERLFDGKKKCKLTWKVF